MFDSKLLLTQRVLNAGKNIENVDISELSAGVYFIQIGIGDQILRAKVVKD
ncbi:MAG: T9SS type A sorting domain-containing protein [Bacteroidota bacterium]